MDIRLLLFLLGVLVQAGAAELKPVPHPFLLWTRDQLDELQARVQSDPEAKRQVQDMLALESRGMKAGGNPALLNLFKYAVLGDAAAGKAEKNALLAFTSAKVPSNREGDPNTRNAAWRDDRTLEALRYDVLHDLLTPEERAAVVAAAKRYIAFSVANPGPWSDAGPVDANAVKVSGNSNRKARTGWLPNMQWPTMAGCHVLAVAIQDEASIRAIAGCDGGWRWYFDHYLADGRFYMEEFAKYASNIGAMLLWCEGLDRLGLAELGWGYTGAGGATMRRHLISLIDAGLPRLPRPGAPGAWDYPVVWMGDAGREWLVSRNQQGQVNRWSQANMQGAIGKMRPSLWWEAGHRRFPDAGFAWFLAEHRPAGDPTYLPSLYFGLKPIPAAEAKAPPAPSFVARERGFAMLRSDESPAYWSSPAPAVALQFGMYYVHYIHDAFSILDFVANHHLVYDKVGRSGTGYAGGDTWRDHGRGQASAVVVDDLQAKFVDGGERGCECQRIRHRFDGPVRFCAVRAIGIFPEVDQERALVLAPEYLIDVSWLTSPRSRVYDWHVLSSGSLVSAADEWKEATAFPDGRIRDQALARPPMLAPQARDAGDATWGAIIRLRGAKKEKVSNSANSSREEAESLKAKLQTGESSVTPETLSERVVADAAEEPGVRVTMLGEPATVLICGRPPGLKDGDPGVKLMATRTIAATSFVAVHEPLPAQGGPRLRLIERLAQDVGGVALRLSGDGIDDRVVIRTGEAAGEAATFAGGGERLIVADQAWIRISADRVDAWGDVRAMDVKVTGAPTLWLNGAEAKASVVAGVLRWAK